MEETKRVIELCLLDLRNWMTINKLKLNTDKTELAVFYSKFCAKPDLFSIKVEDQIIHPKKFLRNNGSIFDESVSMLTQVNSICKSAFFHLRNLSRIRKYLSRAATERLVGLFMPLLHPNWTPITLYYMVCTSTVNRNSKAYLTLLLAF